MVMTADLDITAKFEAGTGNIADAVGLGAALNYVSRLGIENIARYEHALFEHGMCELAAIRGVRLIGTAADKASVMSFVLAGYSTQVVGAALNEQGVAVRTGHHCAQPILRRFGVETTVRPSLAYYHTVDAIDRMVKVLQQLAGRGRAIQAVRRAGTHRPHACPCRVAADLLLIIVQGAPVQPQSGDFR